MKKYLKQYSMRLYFYFLLLLTSSQVASSSLIACNHAETNQPTNQPQNYAII